jgi:ribosomal silencing factor RsfS
MIVKQLIEVFDTLDSADASGLKVKEYLESKGATNVEVVKREKDGKSTDFVKVVIPGSNGRLKGGNAPSLVTEIYANAFTSYKFGYASAEAWVLVAVILVVTAIQFWGQKKWVHY